jgi:hypothetical protein
LLPIKKAVIKFRDNLEKYLKDGVPNGNFTGNNAIEEELREPRDRMRPHEADNLRRADLPRDLRQALVSLWQKCWRYGSGQIELHDAIDEVLEIIAKIDGTQTTTEAVWRGNNRVQIGDTTIAFESQDAAVLGALVNYQHTQP